MVDYPTLTALGREARQVLSEVSELQCRLRMAEDENERLKERIVWLEAARSIEEVAALTRS